MGELGPAALAGLRARVTGSPWETTAAQIDFSRDRGSSIVRSRSATPTARIPAGSMMKPYARVTRTTCIRFHFARHCIAFNPGRHGLKLLCEARLVGLGCSAAADLALAVFVSNVRRDAGEQTLD